jgi:hypothetical protein
MPSAGDGRRFVRKIVGMLPRQERFTLLFLDHSSSLDFAFVRCRFESFDQLPAYEGLVFVCKCRRIFPPEFCLSRFPPRRGIWRALRAHARGDATAARAMGGSAMNTPISLAALLERFFTQRLMQQRQASPHTISSYFRGTGSFCT